MAEKLTKAERREIAREKARKLREEQERREKRNKLLMIGGVILLVALVGLAIVAIFINANRSHLDGVHAPAGADLQGGISVGQDLSAGSETEGAIVVNVYADATCVFCAEFEETNGADIEELLADGVITLKQHPIAILDNSYNGIAANALATTAEYAPEHFLALNTVIFEEYRNIMAEYEETGNYGLPTLSGVEEMALEAGVPQDVVDRFAEGEFDEWVEASGRQFYRDGYEGTPVVVVDGERLGNEWRQPGALREMITGD